MVKAAADYLSGAKPPFVRCPICTTTQLSIRGLLLYTSPDAEELAELPDLKPGVVLICGHMVCKPCWEQTMAHHRAQPRDADFRPLACPICRVKLRHTQCGCELLPWDIPANEKDNVNCPREDQQQFYRYHDDQWARNFPTTLSEGGARPVQCARHALRAAELRAAQLRPEVDANGDPA